MEQKQLSRTNKILLITHLIAAVFMCIGLVLQLNRALLPDYMSIVPMVAVILAAAGSVVMYLISGSKKLYTRFAAAAFGVAYGVTLLLSAIST